MYTGYEEALGTQARTNGTSDHGPEVGSGERVVSGIAGGLMLLSGLGMLTRRPIAGALLASAGGYLTYRGASGRCGMYRAVGATADPEALSHPFSRPVSIGAAVRIDRPRSVLYQRWRRFEHLPFILKHVKHVQQIDNHRFRWTLQAGPRRTAECVTEITSEREGEALAWRTTEGSDVRHYGSIRFEPAVGGRGTIVRVDMEYYPPAGAVGAFVAKILGRDPARQVQKDLARFKQVMETGEVATNEGPSGRDKPSAEDRSALPEPAPAETHCDDVEEAGEQSFPASDPPAWTPGRA